MSDRAVWRRNPDDPKNALGWLLADADRALRSLGESLGCLGKIVGGILIFLDHPLIGVALFFATSFLPKFGRPPRSVEPLLTLPLSAPTYPCTLDVTREGTTIGVDRGVVTFIEGWLHFEGYRTTFSISRSDVRTGDRNGLAFEAGGGVAFHPDDVLRIPGGEQTDCQGAFADQLDRWFRLDPAAQGHSVRPPLALHPSGVARAWLDLAVSVVKTLAILAALLYAIFAFHLGWFVFVFGGFGGAVDALAHLRRVRRFAHEAKRALPNDPRPSAFL